MKRILALVFGFWFTFVIGNWCTWGPYGSFLAQATKDFRGVPWPALIGVGLAYLIIAYLAIEFIALPMLKKKGLDPGGGYSSDGNKWSTNAGSLVASGAVSLVFGVNLCPGSHGQAMPIVFIGVPIVATLFVLKTNPPKAANWPVKNRLLFGLAFSMLLVFGYLMLSLKATGGGSHKATADQGNLWMLFIGWTVLSWGLYVPMIHKGSSLMHGTNKLCQSLRAMTKVGKAYFFIAVCVPGCVLLFGDSKVEFSTAGATNSFIAGTLGVCGALCIILATNFLGKDGPLTVPPLVFSGTPAVNTAIYLWGVYQKNGGSMPADFQLRTLLVAVCIGMVAIVLFLKNKPKPAPAAAKH